MMSIEKIKSKVSEIWKNKRSRNIAIAAVAVAVCVVVTVAANNFATRPPLSPPEDINTDTEDAQEPVPLPVPEPEQKPEPGTFTYDLSFSRYDIDGSTATIPLTEAIYEFYGQSANAPEHNTTPYAYNSLIEGKADLIFATYPSQDELKRAEEAGIEFEITPVVKDALVFLVNIENPLESITKEQLRDIYLGNIKSWSEVGGFTEDIIPYQRTPNSGSQTLMLKLLMDGQKPMQAPEEYIEEQMGDLVDIVSAYDNSSSAIGYSMFYYVNNMYGNNRFKLLAVDGVKPARDTIMDDEYPMGTAYYAVIRKDQPQDSAERKLLDWLLTDEGQTVAIKAGYIPLRPVEDIYPDAEIDPLYLGDYKNSKGTGGDVWKGWNAREQLETNGVKKPLSAVFYNGFNYIEYINTRIADELQALDLYHTRYMNSDTFDVVLKRSFPGIPNDYPHYSFGEYDYDMYELNIEFPDGNPYFRDGEMFTIKLTKDISPYGGELDPAVSYTKAGQIVPGANLAKPVFDMPQAQATAEKINKAIQSWTDELGNNSVIARQIEWRLKERERLAVDNMWFDNSNYIVQPEVGYWKNYVSVSYALDCNIGQGENGPLLSSICFDLNTGERVNIAEKLPENIDYAKASAIMTPYWQTETGQRGGESCYTPARGSVVTNAIIWYRTMVIYVTEPDGRVIECIFWQGDFD